MDRIKPDIGDLVKLRDNWSDFAHRVSSAGLEKDILYLVLGKVGLYVRMIDPTGRVFDFIRRDYLEVLNESR